MTYSNPSLLTHLSNSRIHFGISLSRKLAIALFYSVNLQAIA
ncbi:MAG: hypothetical protein V7K40_22570 [Nostoc sp.]